MSINRRRFLETTAANAAALALAPSAALAVTPRPASRYTSPAPIVWDLSWTERVKGKHRAVFDCTEPESGSGPWRAHMWVGQNMDVLKASADDVTPVIVLRHKAIVLAMKQSFWDKYKIGEKSKVTDPMTDKPTDRNPALMDSPASLPKQLAAGAVVLACGMAIQQCVKLIEDSEKVSHAEAEKIAIASMIPGVILQPSGVFAVVRAQEAGAAYIKAS